MATKKSPQRSTTKQRRSRPRLRHRSKIMDAMLEEEINQQLQLANKFKELLWTLILEKVAPELRPLLQTFDSVRTVDSLFPRYAQPTSSLRSRLEWMVMANVDAEKKLKEQAPRTKRPGPKEKGVQTHPQRRPI